MDNAPLPALVPQDPGPAIAELAARYRRANGPVMQLVNGLGGTIESQLPVLPDAARMPLERVVARALEAAYGLAARAPDLGPRAPLVAVMASGAAGGAGGIATSIAELPVTVTLILNAIRAEAAEAGFDPSDRRVQVECLRVFGSGGPLAGDDGVDTSFLTAKMAISGTAVRNLIGMIAPRLAGVLGQKLTAQAVPVLGAMGGAAVNAAFLRYYREVARIRFALLRLAEVHGAEPVMGAFAAAVRLPQGRRRQVTGV